MLRSGDEDDFTVKTPAATSSIATTRADRGRPSIDGARAFCASTQQGSFMSEGLESKPKDDPILNADAIGLLIGDVSAKVEDPNFRSDGNIGLELDLHPYARA